MLCAEPSLTVMCSLAVTFKPRQGTLIVPVRYTAAYTVPLLSPEYSAAETPEELLLSDYFATKEN